MSIQTKEYISKKTGKTKTKYYAVVFDVKADKSIWSKGLKTEREAKREEARLLHELENGTIVTNKVKFEEVVKLWLNSYKGIYANSTYQGYVWYYNHYLKPVFDGKWINDIQPIHIQRFIDCMSKKYAAETVNKNINVLSKIFSYAVNPLKIMKENHASGITRKKVSIKKGVTWSEKQILDFISYEKVITSPYYEVIITSFLLGVRPSEVCGLSESDLTANGILFLNRGYDRYGEISNMKTDRSHRPIKLSEEHFELIKNRLLRQHMEAKKKGDAYDRNDFLFKQKNGKPINPNVYTKAFKRLLRAYNQESNNDLPSLPDICLYGARHSFATNLIANKGVSTTLISQLMGNSERVCNERYVHPSDNIQATIISEYSSNIFNKEVS